MFPRSDNQINHFSFSSVLHLFLGGRGGRDVPVPVISVPSTLEWFVDQSSLHRESRFYVGSEQTVLRKQGTQLKVITLFSWFFDLFYLFI